MGINNLLFKIIFILLEFAAKLLNIVPPNNFVDSKL